MQNEVELPGGNIGGAVRIGDTVRRATGPWTPAIHGLLNYLAGAGLTGVPRVHGYDERGREVPGVIRWRAGAAELAADQIICMHDYGYYNWIGTADGFSGVIDWDLAGPRGFG